MQSKITVLDIMEAISPGFQSSIPALFVGKSRKPCRTFVAALASTPFSGPGCLLRAVPAIIVGQGKVIMPETRIQCPVFSMYGDRQQIKDALCKMVDDMFDLGESVAKGKPKRKR